MLRSFIPESERKRAFELSSKLSMASLGLVWQILFKGYQELQAGLHLVQHGEMIILRLIYLYDGPGPNMRIKPTFHIDRPNRRSYAFIAASRAKAHVNPIL